MAKTLILQWCVARRATVRRVAPRQAGRVQRWRVAPCGALPACAPTDEPATQHSPLDCAVLLCGVLRCEGSRPSHAWALHPVPGRRCVAVQWRARAWLMSGDTSG